MIDLWKDEIVEEMRDEQTATDPGSLARDMFSTKQAVFGERQESF